MPLSKLRNGVRHAIVMAIAVFIVIAAGSFGVIVSQETPARTVTVEGVVKPGLGKAGANDQANAAGAKSEPMAIFATGGRQIAIADDEGGRMFYLDPAMRGREVRLKLIEKGPGRPAEVIQSEVRHEGRWRVPQYYCDVCTIAVRYPQVCLCCQGPMEFRYKPER
jgi:hypothetical protein